MWAMRRHVETDMMRHGCTRRVQALTGHVLRRCTGAEAIRKQMAHRKDG